MIPKKIHYCWFGSAPIPDKDKKCIESWKRLCPDYEIIKWNENNYDLTKNEYMHQAYQAQKWGFVPDYARLDIIYNHGGFYLDTDVELIQALDDMLKYKAIFGFEYDEYNINLGLGFGAEKNNNLILALRDMYNDIRFYNNDGSLNLLPSPAYSSKGLENAGFIMNGKRQIKDDCVVFPADYFCPKNYYTGKMKKTKNTHGIHWFNASWQTPHQKRMHKIQKIVGIKNYNRLVEYKNKYFKKRQ